MKFRSNHHNQKISLSNLAKRNRSPCRINPRILPLHIYYQAQHHDIFILEQENIIKKISTPPKRRKIFDQLLGYQRNDVKTAAFIKIAEDKIMENSSKKTKQVTFRCAESSDEEYINRKLQEINKQIHKHRLMAQHGVQIQKQQAHLEFKRQKQEDFRSQLQRIQQKTLATYQLLKTQQSILTNKIPEMSKMINKSDKKINQVKKIMQESAIKSANKQKMFLQAIDERQKSILYKENVISRVESQLNYCKSQNALKSYEAEMNMLEVQRLRRIQELQMNNLKMYNSLSWSRKQKISIDDFKDIYPEQFSKEEIEWVDTAKQSKISTIEDMVGHYCPTGSKNNTIGEFLSPLTWQYNRSFD